MAEASKARWIVATPKPISSALARETVRRAFGVHPASDDIEVALDALDLGRIFVIDREAVEAIPDTLRIDMRDDWLRSAWRTRWLTAT